MKELKKRVMKALAGGKPKLKNKASAKPVLPQGDFTAFEVSRVLPRPARRDL